MNLVLPLSEYKIHLGGCSETLIFNYQNTLYHNSPLLFCSNEIHFEGIYEISE